MKQRLDGYKGVLGGLRVSREGRGMQGKLADSDAI